MDSPASCRIAHTLTGLKEIEGEWRSEIYKSCREGSEKESIEDVQDQDEHFDICESESDTEHNVNDLESGTSVPTSLTQEEVNNMEKKLLQLEGEKKLPRGSVGNAQAGDTREEAG